MKKEIYMDAHELRQLTESDHPTVLSIEYDLRAYSLTSWLFVEGDDADTLIKWDAYNQCFELFDVIFVGEQQFEKKHDVTPQTFWEVVLMLQDYATVEDEGEEEYA